MNFKHNLNMRALSDLQLFIATVEAGSLSAAARKLGLTPAAASAALQRLEVELGAPLLARSTRRQRITPQGELLLESARQAVDLLTSAGEQIRGGQVVAQGHLQVSMPSDLGRHVLLPWLNDFMAAHPRISLRLQVSDRLADVYGQPVDIVIRYGVPTDSDLIALPLAPDARRVLVASPEHLRRHGDLRHPRELAQRNCLCYVLGEQVHQRWRFWREGQPFDVDVRGDRQADDGEVVRRWALAGLGIAYKSRLDVQADLNAGALVVLCPDWQGEASPLNLLCADRRQLGPAVRLLQAFLVERLALWGSAGAVESGAGVAQICRLPVPPLA